MNIKIDSVLLFALVIPFIMSVRLSPGQTPYWLFGLIFLGLLLYIVLDIIKLSTNLCFKLKQGLLWLIIIGVIGSAFISAIIVRHQTAPIYQIHDIVIQQETAMRFLLDGQNPYKVTYFGTPLEQWHYSDKETNPALYHFVMQPFYLLFSLPFYFMSITLFGFFDGRIPLLFLFAMLLIFAAKLVEDQQKRLLFLIVLAFNPAMLLYTLEGRSDIFMYAFLFLGLYLLHRQKYSLSGIPIAMAFAIKQSAWPLLPFYLSFLYFKAKNIGKIVKFVAPFVITLAILIAPFIVWDAKSFFDSTIFYLSGSTSSSYPISGYGLGSLLFEWGFIKDLHQYYPFHIWQILVGIPLLIVLFRFLKKAPSVARLILVYGIFLFVSWYFFRYFNNSHLGYLSMVFMTAYFWPTKNLK